MSVQIPTDRTDTMPLSVLLKELLGKIGELLTLQMALVKTEIKEESRKLAVAGALGFLAVLLGFCFLLFLGFSLFFLLANVLEPHWAMVATTAVFLVLTALIILMAARELRKNSA